MAAVGTRSVCPDGTCRDDRASGTCETNNVAYVYVCIHGEAAFSSLHDTTLSIGTLGRCLYLYVCVALVVVGCGW